jgi:hypothetical protein
MHATNTITKNAARKNPATKPFIFVVMRVTLH